MSIWRCASCSYIVDNRTNGGNNPCPNCGSGVGDSSFAQMDMYESWYLWEKQQNKEKDEAIRQLVQKIKSLEKSLEDMKSRLKERE